MEANDWWQHIYRVGYLVSLEDTGRFTVPEEIRDALPREVGALLSGDGYAYLMDPEKPLRATREWFTAPVVRQLQKAFARLTPEEWAAKLQELYNYILEGSGMAGKAARYVQMADIAGRTSEVMHRADIRSKGRVQLSQPAMFHLGRPDNIYLFAFFKQQVIEIRPAYWVVTKRLVRDGVEIRDNTRRSQARRDAQR